MANKFIHKVTWNKKLDNVSEKPSYELGSTNAENIYINTGEGDKKITLQVLFSWIKDFFEKGVFTYVGENEPQSQQTKIWFDTTSYQIISKEQTSIDYIGKSQIVRLTVSANDPILLEKPNAEWTIDPQRSYANPVSGGGLGGQISYLWEDLDIEEIEDGYLFIRGLKRQSNATALDYYLFYN